MFDALQEALSGLSAQMFLWMSVGVIVSTVIAVIPGLGGTFAVVMLLPFIAGLPPEVGIVMLMASVAVDGTGNTITSVLFGTPGSATGVAGILDGYPMAKRGEGNRAVSASLVASAVGGTIGAVALIPLLPLLRPLVTSLRSPEFFALIFAALVFMAFVAEGSMLKSLISGFAGLMLSFVGLEISTGTARYTFGNLYLWDGLQLIPVMIGIFAIAEMMTLLSKGGSIANVRANSGTISQMLQGVADVFIHWRTTLIGSVTGLVIGMAPGLGASVGQFIAYAQAAKMSRNGDTFGKGNVEGVIAPSASTNSVDGGSLIPTLTFGIPGSAPMAIVLAAMISMGLSPGQEMLTTNLDIVWTLLLTLVIANIMAAAICLVAGGLMSRATNVHATVLAPLILIISLFGAYATTSNLGDVVTAMVFGCVGFAMVRFGYSRATFVIGFVLGALLEQHYLLSMRIYGWGFLTRPFAMTISLLAVVVLVLAVAKAIKQWRTSRRDQECDGQLGRKGNEDTNLGTGSSA